MTKRKRVRSGNFYPPPRDKDETQTARKNLEDRGKWEFDQITATFYNGGQKLNLPVVKTNYGGGSERKKGIYSKNKALKRFGGRGDGRGSAGEVENRGMDEFHWSHGRMTNKESMISTFVVLSGRREVVSFLNINRNNLVSFSTSKDLSSWTSRRIFVVNPIESI